MLSRFAEDSLNHLDSSLCGITSDLPACLAMVAAQQREPGGGAPCGCGLSRMGSSPTNGGLLDDFGFNQGSGNLINPNRMLEIRKFIF